MPVAKRETFFWTEGTSWAAGRRVETPYRTEGAEGELDAREDIAVGCNRGGVPREEERRGLRSMVDGREADGVLGSYFYLDWRRWRGRTWRGRGLGRRGGQTGIIGRRGFGSKGE